MKKSLVLLSLFAVLASALPAQEPLPSPGRVAVAFLGFESPDIAPSGLGILGDLVRHEISIAPRYSLVERADLAQLLREQEFQVSDYADPEKAVRIGRMVGAEKLIVGGIGILGSLYIINLRMIDVASGTADRSQTEEFIGALEDLRKPVRIAAQKILGVPGIEVAQGEFVSVETDPPGVGVYVNGLFEGDSPLVVRLPKPGKYSVKLAAEGYRAWMQSVSVEASSTYFVKARLLKQEAVVDERVKALQDGRPGFITFATIYAAGASEALLYAFGSDNVRLYVGLPLVAGPVAFYASLKLTEGAVMNSGRNFMITSSALWGTTWGLAAFYAFGAEAAPGEPRRFEPAYAGLSALGGLAYGALSTYLTAGRDPFPSSRVWLYNLGSVLGAFLGLGVPYVLGADSPGIIYAGMLTGSVAGSATALYLTRGYSEGRNIGNISVGSLIEASPEGAGLGIPLLRPGASNESPGYYLPIARFSY
jgi:hypothetical protein